MKITIDTIESERDYERVLRELERLVDMNPRDGTVECARCRALGILVEAYEDDHFPLGELDPIAAIEFRLEQAGLDDSALVGIIGSRQRVWEVLHGKRDLTLPMIQRLHRELGIPAESLIGA